MSTKSPPDEIRRLRMSVDWALRQALAPQEVVPMLRRLARAAPPESDDFSFAHRHLAELSVESEPWHAALSARQVLCRYPDDDRAWAVLGLSYTLLGHYRAAIGAYRRAVGLSPANPWYAHNLGHLIDIALGRPGDALPLLAAALRKEPREVEIATSYAHALAAAGQVQAAGELLRRYIKNGGTADQKALLRWIEKGAPAEEDVIPARRRRSRARAGTTAARKRTAKAASPPPSE